MSLWGAKISQKPLRHNLKFGKIYYIGFISGFNSRFDSNYRTCSHAGFPRGSYMIPNPTHFHIACERHIALRRPQITSITSHFIPSQQSTFRTKNAKIIINLEKSHAVSLNIPVDTVTRFILPIESALNLRNIPSLSHKGCQTTYINNSEYISSSTQELNMITYTPLFVDSYKTCRAEQESIEKSKLYEERVLENLQREIRMSEFPSETSESEMSLNISLDEASNKQFASETNRLSSVSSTSDDCEMENLLYKKSDDEKVTFDELVIKITNIIKEYTKQLLFKMKELILFSDILCDGNKIKLMNDLVSTYTKYLDGKLSLKEQNELRTSIVFCASQQLKDDETLRLGEHFNLTELLNNILDHFFKITNSFNHTCSLMEGNSISYQSTPKRQKFSDTRKTTSFKKRMDSKSGSEFYWNTKENNSPMDSDSSLSSYNASYDNTVIKNSKFSETVSSSMSDKSLFHNLFLSNDSLSDSSDSSQIITSNKPRANILQNSANFIRRKNLDQHLYNQTKKTTFKLSGSENKENIPEDSGDWMGYQGAKF